MNGIWLWYSLNSMISPGFGFLSRQFPLDLLLRHFVSQCNQVAQSKCILLYSRRQYQS